jgi:lysozyme family protein
VPQHRGEHAAPAISLVEAEADAIITDFHRVVEEGIKNLESYWGLTGKLEHVRNFLKYSANRTFLWVFLVLDILND